MRKPPIRGSKPPIVRTVGGRGYRVEWHHFGPTPEVWAEYDRRVRDLAGDIIGLAMDLVSMPSPPPSQPGMPPGTVTGRLKGSFYVKKLLTGRHVIGNSAPYARGLEVGTPRTDPRPFLTPAMIAFASEFAGIRIREATP